MTQFAVAKESAQQFGGVVRIMVRDLPKYLAPPLFFFVMALPHRDDVTAGAALGPNDTTIRPSRNPALILRTSP
jgi:hypothetical protein